MAKWIVSTGKDEFVLTEQEAMALKDASMRGKGLIWFKTFAVSIAHIESVRFVKDPVFQDVPALPEPTPEDRERMHERIGEAKEKLLAKVAI